MTLDGVSKASKLLSVSLSEDRLSALLPLLNQNIQVLREGTPTAQLTKEIEPTTFLFLIKRAAEP